MIKTAQFLKRNRILVLIIALVLNLLKVYPVFSNSPDSLIKWTDAKELGIAGKGWKNDSSAYSRLPAKAEGHIPDAVWELGKQTAGIYLHFFTDAPAIKAKWGLTNESLGFPHFAPTGVSGLDLYVKTEDNSWHWLGVGKPRQKENLETLVDGIPEGRREYLLYLPLYNGITHLEIGIPRENKIEKAPSGTERSIVFYGTSITQGGCASRPGMCSTAILGRRLNRNIINLGFSGSGRMEPEIARLLSELDPEIYFIDCLPNLEASDVAVRVEPFIRILREAHPNTPIVLAEGITYDDAFLVKTRDLRNTESRKALRNAYENLLKSGVRNLYYQIAEGELGSDGEGTVDGTHPTDLGFMRQADVYELVLKSILQKLQ
jgi:GDSL-like Lipase/Acylhydrolase family/N-terminus of Esterase_SGNH_hydro-type